MGQAHACHKQLLGVFMTVDIIGGSRRESACAEILRNENELPGFSKTILLPIPSSRNGEEITGTKIKLLSLIDKDMSGVLIAGYALPSVFCSLVEEKGGALADVSYDETFTEENARLTAESTLLHIMNTCSASAEGMRIGIVGYGRIGKCLAELLLFLGARITVFTRREHTKMELLFSGVDAQLVADADFSRCDILINTAPARLFTQKQCDTLSCEVLELAPGENFPGAEKVTRLPSLPAKILPVSGGRVYARAIVRALKKGNEA